MIYALLIIHFAAFAYFIYLCAELAVEYRSQGRVLSLAFLLFYGSLALERAQVAYSTWLLAQTDLPILDAWLTIRFIGGLIFIGSIVFVQSRLRIHRVDRRNE